LAGAFAAFAVPDAADVVDDLVVDFPAVDFAAVDLAAVDLAAVFGAAFVPSAFVPAAFDAVPDDLAALDFVVDFVVDFAPVFGADLLAVDFAAAFGADFAAVSGAAAVVPVLARVREERAGAAAASADTPVRGDRRGALVAPSAASLLFPICSRNAAPGRNDGTIVSGTGTVSPVRGLRATRAARRRGSNTPNPVSVTEEPDPTVSTITSTSPSTAAAAVRRSPIRVVRASTS
jgi:hypothetical protein